MSISKQQVLKLYRDMMREAKKFQAYNFRNYTLRKIKDSFYENKKISDPKQIQEKFDVAQKNFEVLKRQVIVGSLYKADFIVVETKKNERSNK